MPIVRTGRVVELRDLRELEMLVPGVATPEGSDGVRGEVEAYSLSLRLLESMGKRLVKIIGARLVDMVELSEGTKRRVEFALNGIKKNNLRAIESSNSRTIMLEFLRGHVRGLEEVIQILEAQPEE